MLKNQLSLLGSLGKCTTLKSDKFRGGSGGYLILYPENSPHTRNFHPFFHDTILKESKICNIKRRVIGIILVNSINRVAKSIRILRVNIAQTFGAFPRMEWCPPIIKFSHANVIVSWFFRAPIHSPLSQPLIHGL